MSQFDDRCLRLAAALGSQARSHQIDRAIWPGMPGQYTGRVWVWNRPDGRRVILGETFKAALRTATTLGQQRR